ERVVDRLRRQGQHVELRQGVGPVDGLGDARQLEEIVGRAQLLDESHDLPRELLGRTRRLYPQDLELALGGGVVDPEIEAAALQRVMDLARAVGGDDDDRRLLGLDHAQLRDRHLEIAEQLQQERLERLVRAVELIDQQNLGAADLALQVLQQRPFDQEPFGENVRGDAVLGFAVRRFGEADLQHLARIIPFIYRARDIEPL